MFLEGANLVIRRLWRDESGVVLALTIVVFLTLFILGCSVFAVGETVRERIELQNAADAAAYSGAVIQADTISCIAAINRAMGFTYVMMNRMEMDYIVDKWLMLVVEKWKKDYAHVMTYVKASNCKFDDWYVGQGYGMRRHVFLNRRIWVEIDEIIKARLDAAQNQSNYGMLAPRIDLARQNILMMNAAEQDLIARLPARLRGTVRKVAAENVAETGNDETAGGANFMYALISKPESCFKDLRDEHWFLRMVFGRGTKVEDLLDRGTDKWWKLGPSGDGIWRFYEQQANHLIAEWAWRGGTWQWVGDPPVCTLVNQTQGDSAVRGIDAKPGSEKYFESEKAEPNILALEYFDKAGAVVVGVARRQNNPLQFMMGDGSSGNEGTLKVFWTGANRYAWAASAARAGYWDENRPPYLAHKMFNPTVDSWELERDLAVPLSQLSAWWRSNWGWWGLSPYHLSQTRWDAVLLPIRRAWSKRMPAWQPRSQGTGGNYMPGRWLSETGGQILEALANAAWEPITGSGSFAESDRSAPRGMSGLINYGGMDEHVYH